MANTPAELARRALTGELFATARLISTFEDSRPDAGERRREALSVLRTAPERKRARFTGITGTPGAGKSTLVGELATRMIAADDSLKVAVLAVDPTSVVSGGALLGDRTRVRFPADESRLFFRSQSSDRELGGLGRHTFQVCRVLEPLFDHVLIETVGIGQSEVEVRHVAERVFLVLQPLAGDQIQFMKAGIMEIPDAFVLNKCDQVEAARRSYHALRASLRFARPVDGVHGRAPIFRTSATTGEGLDELAEAITAVEGAEHEGSRAPAVRRQAGLDVVEPYFFRRWV